MLIPNSEAFVIVRHLDYASTRKILFIIRRFLKGWVQRCNDKRNVWYSMNVFQFYKVLYDNCYPNTGDGLDTTHGRVMCKTEI